MLAISKSVEGGIGGETATKEVSEGGWLIDKLKVVSLEKIMEMLQAVAYVLKVVGVLEVVEGL